MNEAGLLEAGITSGHVLENRTDQRHLGQIGDGEKAGAQPIFDIMIVVRDVIGERGDLSLEARPTVQLPIDRIFGGVGGGGAGLRGGGPKSGPLCLTTPSSVSQVRLRPSNSA